MKASLFAKLSFLSMALLATGFLITGETQGQDTAPVSLVIEAGEVAGQVSPIHSGLMTEEINHSYDGGLYAELVQNRAFEDDARNPVHWSAVQGGGATAALSLDGSNAINEALTTCLRVDVAGASASARAGVANEGYWGIPVKPATRYKASFYAKAGAGFAGPVTVTIESVDGSTVYAKAEVPSVTGQWQQYAVALTTGAVTPTAQARLVLAVNSPGTLWLNLVSLFPPTWNGRENGLRPDLMKMMADMHPAFLRFPGGNFLEGDTVEKRFEWKKTIGPVAERPGHWGPWGYRSTDGMGMMEFLLWAEDLGAEPVLAVYAGYSLKGMHVNPGADLDPYVQDALDEIEYVSGPATSKWGAERAKDGHPAPFPLHYVEIGNEDWFDNSGSYNPRFAQLYDAIKAKYPDIKCISTVGTEQPAEKRVTSRTPDAVDEHYYRSAADFEKMSPARFEGYKRGGPEIFVGEWAAFEDVEPWKAPSGSLPRTPNMKAALGDAVWMAAMERNSDIVTMQCYAPLLVNVNPGASQWRPNLIGYDATRVYGSPSYYAIKLFNENRGDGILKGTLEGGAGGVQYSATKAAKTGVIYVKLVNVKAVAQAVNITLNGVTALAPEGRAETLAAGSLTDTNSIDEPTKVSLVTTPVPGIRPTFSYTLPPYSITALRMLAR